MYDATRVNKPLTIDDNYAKIMKIMTNMQKGEKIRITPVVGLEVRTFKLIKIESMVKKATLHGLLTK